MATTNAASDREGTVVESYVLDIRIVALDEDGADTSYRFEAPEHADITFGSREDAARYADVYFSVNGFVEADTGTRGVPPEIVQAGKDTLATYLVTMPWADVNWVASFYGTTPTVIERYLSWVHERAEEIRQQAAAETAE